MIKIGSRCHDMIGEDLPRICLPQAVGVIYLSYSFDLRRT